MKNCSAQANGTLLTHFVRRSIEPATKTNCRLIYGKNKLLEKGKRCAVVVGFSTVPKSLRAQRFCGGLVVIGV